MTLFHRIVRHLADRPFVRSAREDPEDPQVFKRKPTAAVILGIFLILLSYVIGWPAVGVLGLLSYHTGKPLILIVGGPIVYGLSHLVFLVGLYLAGKPYAVALAKGAIRAAFDRMVPDPAEKACPDRSPRSDATSSLRRDKENGL